MAMEPKTLSTIARETEQLYQKLLDHLKKSRDICSTEKERILIDYIIDREHWLAVSFNDLETAQYNGALNTWYYEYTDRHNILISNPADIPFSQMSYEDICEALRQFNADIIDLFTHLKERSECEASTLATDTLLQHISINAKQMSQEIANQEGF